MATAMGREVWEVRYDRHAAIHHLDPGIGQAELRGARDAVLGRDRQAEPDARFNGS